jgi:hypothetical protein
MPKEITHWTLAETAFNRFEDNSELKRIIYSHKNLYHLGAVILDTPFYLIFGEKAASIRKDVNRIHDSSVNSLECFGPVVDRYGPNLPEPVLALLFGIITHIYADATFHPLVCYFSGKLDLNNPEKNRRAQSRHHLLETHIDLYYAGKGPFSIKKKFIDLVNKIEIQREELIRLLVALYDLKRIDGGAWVEKAIRSHSLFQSLFANRAAAIFFKFINILPGIDINHLISNFYPVRFPAPNTLFQNPIPYREPVRGEFRSHSLQNLENQAVAQIVDVFQHIETAIRRKLGRDLFSGIHTPNLYTGIEGCRQDQMRYFDDEQDLMQMMRN